MRIMGREWRWWLVHNTYDCSFCYQKGTFVSLLAQLQHDHPGTWQGSPRFWQMLYRVWLRHMKDCHQDLINTHTKEHR